MFVRNSGFTFVSSWDTWPDSLVLKDEDFACMNKLLAHVPFLIFICAACLKETTASHSGQEASWKDCQKNSLQEPPQPSKGEWTRYVFFFFLLTPKPMFFIFSLIFCRPMLQGNRQQRMIPSLEPSRGSVWMDWWEARVDLLPLLLQISANLCESQVSHIRTLETVQVITVRKRLPCQGHLYSNEGLWCQGNLKVSSSSIDTQDKGEW